MNKEPITLHLETFNNEEYILADECIEAIGLHRRTNTELHQTIEEKDKEIERLKQGYCELKEKCNKGECDCTHEEYNNMCEENIKMDLEIERLNSILEEFEEELEREINIKEEDLKIEHNKYIDINSTLRKMLERFKGLKGVDKE